MSDETNKQVQDDEISLIDLFAVLWQRKLMIIVITVIAAISAVVVSVISLKLPPEKNFLPNVYTPKALMLINNSLSSGGGLSSMLSSSGLGSLAGLAGVSIGGGQTYSGLASYLIGTDTLLDSVVDKFDIVERYKITKFVQTSSRNAIKNNLKAEMDDASGVFSISFTDSDPVFARDVVNYCVDYMSDWFKELGLDKTVLQKSNLEQNIQNTYAEILSLQQEVQRLERSVSISAGNLPSIMIENQRINLELSAKQEIYRQLKVQLELTNVSIASESPIFQILQTAEAPDMKSGPGRGMICIIATFAAFFFSVFLAFALNALENIRKDPEAMAKLKTGRKKEKE